MDYDLPEVFPVKAGGKPNVASAEMIWRVPLKRYPNL